MFGDSTLEPSTNIPLPPRNDRIEQFWIYGDLVITDLPVFTAYPALDTKGSSGSSKAQA